MLYNIGRYKRSITIIIKAKRVSVVYLELEQSQMARENISKNYTF